MKTVTSKDGTTIAFDQSGRGPALILVGGMFEQRALDSETAQLAAFPLLAQHRTLEGQTHEVTAEALGPVLVEFFTS